MLLEGTGYRVRTRFAKFFNLADLVNIWKQCADVQTEDMLNLPVPKVENVTIVTKPTDIQQDSIQEFADRATDVRNFTVKPNEDNMLRITSDGRKLALDQRLINPLYPDEPDSKINAVVGNVHKIWEDSTPVKGTQLIFCDISTPKGDGSFNVYDDIRNKLVGKGVPREQVAFIHEANTETQKKELFSKVRSGNVRVLIGSTQKCGTGTNIQDKSVALHHTDCPWRPSDLSQRDGRIVRQGNTNEEVKIYKYVTEGTFDAYNWSTVEAKQKFIAQVFTSKSPVRSAEDVDDTALSYAEIKALATGDPMIKEKMELDVDVAKLKSMRSCHESECHDLQDLVRTKISQQLQAKNMELENLGIDINTLKSHPLIEDNFKMTVNNTVYTERAEAGQAILDLCKTIHSKEGKLTIGEFRGFSMELYHQFTNYMVALKGESTHSVIISDSSQGCIKRINNALEQIPIKIQQCENVIEQLETDYASAKEEMNKPFPREAELSEKSERLSFLNTELEQSNEENVEKDNDQQEISEKKTEKPEMKQGSDGKIEKQEKKEKRPSVLGELKQIKAENNVKPAELSQKKEQLVKAM